MGSIVHVYGAVVCGLPVGGSLLVTVSGRGIGASISNRSNVVREYLGGRRGPVTTNADSGCEKCSGFGLGMGQGGPSLACTACPVVRRHHGGISVDISGSWAASSRGWVRRFSPCRINDRMWPSVNPVMVSRIIASEILPLFHLRTLVRNVATDSFGCCVSDGADGRGNAVMAALLSLRHGEDFSGMGNMGMELISILTQSAARPNMKLAVCVTLVGSISCESRRRKKSSIAAIKPATDSLFVPEKHKGLGPSARWVVLGLNPVPAVVRVCMNLVVVIGAGYGSVC